MTIRDELIRLAEAWVDEVLYRHSRRGVEAKAAEQAFRAYVDTLQPDGRAFAPTHRHYKGGLYQVLHEATDEYGQWKVIVYRAADGRIWTRQKHVFNERLPDGRLRFEPLRAALLSDTATIAAKGGE